MYKYLESLGWKDEGLNEDYAIQRTFTITSREGNDFILKVDLQYMGGGTWLDIYLDTHLPMMVFSGVVFSNEEIPVLMKQLQITI